jgi:hypothetical protein
LALDERAGGETSTLGECGSTGTQSIPETIAPSVQRMNDLIVKRLTCPASRRGRRPWRSVRRSLGHEPGRMRIRRARASESGVLAWVASDDPARQGPGWLGLRAGWTRCSGVRSHHARSRGCEKARMRRSGHPWHPRAQLARARGRDPPGPEFSMPKTARRIRRSEFATMRRRSMTG